MGQDYPRLISNAQGVSQQTSVVARYWHLHLKHWQLIDPVQLP